MDLELSGLIARISRTRWVGITIRNLRPNTRNTQGIDRVKAETRQRRDGSNPLWLARRQNQDEEIRANPRDWGFTGMNHDGSDVEY